MFKYNTGLRSMTKVESEIFIHGPAAEIFAFISDPHNNPQWQAGMQSCRVTSDGPLGIGSSYHQIARFMGREIISNFVITAFEPGRLIRGETVESTFPISFTRIVEPHNSREGSIVKAIVCGDASGFIQLLNPMMNMMVRRSIKADYRRLKELFENRA